MNEGSLKKDFFWNTAGALSVALSSFVLAFVSMRFLGPQDGGVFSFGFSTLGQQIFTIAYFGIRPMHITDIGGYSFEDYHGARIKTCLLAFIVAAVWLIILIATGSYSFYKGLCIMMLALYKIADGYADVWECELQRIGFLYKAGKELFIRTVLAVLIYTAVCVATGSLIYSCVAAVIMQYGVIALFSRTFAGSIKESKEALSEAGGGKLDGDGENAAAKAATLKAAAVKTSTEKTAAVTGKAVSGRQRELIRDAGFLFISVFLDFYVFSSAKYAVDLKLGDSMSGIFNMLFMPTSIIYLMANFVMKPFMSRMAMLLNDGDTEGFKATRRKLAIGILGLTAICVAACLILGRWALGIIELLTGDAYAGKFTANLDVFTVIIAGGGIYALACLYYYCLVMMKKQKAVFMVYAVVAVLALIVSGPAVGYLGLMGAAAAYLFLMAMLLIGFKVLQK
ncbi:MAG: lipopolysaccharide biosynthesis protein [Eubacteriales bacterium]|nr:lipopolysaccharide biosynthesis protein [Eubacteriales bacterium]